MLNQTHRVKLPYPSLEGGVQLEHCLRERRSIRGFRNRALRIEELGQLLWAAQGVTRSDGGRTVPSAGALYPLEVYVLARKVASRVAGIYRYSVGRHELALTKPDYDPEALMLSQHPELASKP